MTKIKITLEVKGGFKDSRGGWRRDVVIEKEFDDDVLEALSKPRRLTRLMKKAMAELKGDEIVTSKSISAREAS